MSNIYTVEWDGSVGARYPSPQACCAAAMRRRDPFVLSVTGVHALIGDLLIFPDYFVSYPVLRYAEEGEIMYHQPNAYCYVVCQEPPEEITETVEDGADAGETVGAGGGRRDKWGYGR